MIFIEDQGAPDIPLEIINAQEDGRLILFCGAGISMPAGLPSFSKLVTNIGKKLNISEEVKSVCKIKNESEIQCKEQFDILLNNWEEKYSRKKVRELIIQELKLTDDANLETHEAILSLSRTEKSYRLVTTNVDHGFRKLISSKNFPNFVIDAAPKLPVPKSHKWSSVVHLHGIIDEETDPEGDHLIFTSGDFGLAYLHEKWASTFLSELVRNFTILFVGYSFGDPILRYITDAIDAEKTQSKLEKNTNYRDFYILWGEKDYDENSDNFQKNFPINGVKPIFYNSQNKHGVLHKTLKKWAEDVRDGILAKKRFISEKASIGNLALNTNHPDHKRMMEIIKEKAQHTETDDSGKLAEHFNTINPPLPIAWLKGLDEEGLLSLHGDTLPCFPVSTNLAKFLLIPSKITSPLWQWISKHLEEDELIEWVIKKGCNLHPELKRLIHKEIKNVQDADCRIFWNIVTADHSLKTEISYFSLNDFFKDNRSLDTFTNLLTPRFKINDWNSKNNVSKLEAEVIISLSNGRFKEFEKNVNQLAASVTEELLLAVTPLLYRALEMLKELKWEDDNIYNHISYHEQNDCYNHDNSWVNHDNSWVNLVYITRCLWRQASQLGLAITSPTLELWKSIESPLFRRLVLYAYASRPDLIEPAKSLNYLLEEEGKWLWSNITKRENFRLLESLSPKLSETSKSQLFQTILDSPSRTPAITKISEDRNIWLLLSKLKSFGYDLTFDAQQKLDELCRQYPTWCLKEDQSDEFSQIITTSTGYKTDISAESLLHLSPHEIVSKIKETSPYKGGRLTTLQNLAKNNPSKIIEVLSYLDEKKDDDHKIWSYSLLGLSKSTDFFPEEISTLLAKRNPSLFSSISDAICSWIEAVSNNKNFVVKDENEPFWIIVRMFFEANLNKPKTGSRNTPFQTAINSPIGRLTKALLDLLSKNNLPLRTTIQETYLEYFNKILDGSEDSLICGRVILASQLNYLYSLDPIWVKEKLVPKFSWNNEKEASIAWEGYLFTLSSSRLEIITLIKEEILKTFEYASKFPSNIEEKFYASFTLICLHLPDFYTKEEKIKAITTLPKEKLRVITETLWTSIYHTEKNQDFWQNRIKPFVEDCWPHQQDLKNDKISLYFASIIIELEDCFSEALNIVKNFMVDCSESDDFRRFVEKLDQKKLAQNYPQTVFDLLKILLPNRVPPTSSLKELFQKILQYEPSIKDDWRYKDFSHLINYENSKL